MKLLILQCSQVPWNLCHHVYLSTVSSKLSAYAFFSEPLGYCDVTTLFVISVCRSDGMWRHTAPYPWRPNYPTCTFTYRSLNKVRKEEYKNIGLYCCPIMKLGTDWTYSGLCVSHCVSFQTNKQTNALVAELEESVFPTVGHDPQ